MENKNLESLSIDELYALIDKNYKEALKSGVLANIADVARLLGENERANYGPKYRWKKNLISIYVDDYGNYMTVHLEQKLVCSTHPNERRFIHGDWVKQLSKYMDEAKSLKEKITKESIEAKRQELIEKLTI